MPKLIDAYLARLTKRIDRRLPVDEAHDHVQEIGQHIAECRASLEQAGVGPEQAEVEALRQLGSERLIAEGLIREHRGFGLRSVWRIALIPSIVLLVALLVPEAFMVWPIMMGALDLMIWLPAIGTALFVFGCLRSRRVLLLPMATALLLSLLGSLIFFANGPEGITAHAAIEREKNITGFDQEIARLRGGYAAAKSVATSGPIPAAFRSGTGFLAPQIQDSPRYERSIYNPIGWQTASLRRVVLAPAATEGEARRLWMQIGSAYAHQLANDIAEQQSGRSYWVQSKGGWDKLGRAAGIGIIFILQAIAVFAAINFAALGAVVLRDRIIRSRWRPDNV